MSKTYFTGKIFRLRKKIFFLYKERERIERLKHFEQKLCFTGFKCIAGIDEAGRGALAGPVVAAAVMIKEIDSFFIADLKDSKKINKVKREYLFGMIKNKCWDIGIGVVGPEIIDKINIAQATFLAMKRAIMNLRQCPDYILVDAFKIPYLQIPQDNLVKGEDKSVSIAAASIIAKVHRDQLMNKLHERYPAYHFNQNAGYGTKNHFLAIKKDGICPQHRKTFKGVVDGFSKEQGFSKQEKLYKY